ncbi:hypothetical protein GCM10017786_01990 [Amycolatopsis deserti]|uniref:Uncharacterized protein n=1 Tax=Amycolatopsis deserti TaxID=185696 RepID=A0ABQ3IA69_9PSEU|nr:hypothetical protein GCM10017786_01990 [Amycolatopsis deserti]
MGFVLQVAIVVGVVGVFLGSFLTEIGVDAATGAAFQAVIYLLALGAAALIAIRGLDASVRTVVIAAAVSLPLLITVLSGAHTGLELPRQFDLDELSVNGTFQGFAADVTFLVGFREPRGAGCRDAGSEAERSPRRHVIAGRARQRVPACHDRAASRARRRVGADRSRALTARRARSAR